MGRTKILSTIFAIYLMQITSLAHTGELSPGLSVRLRQIPPQAHISVIIHMADQADLIKATKGIVGRNKTLRSKNVIRVLQSTAAKRQKDLITLLKKEKALGNVADYTLFWIFNGLSLKATPEVVRTVALRDDVYLVCDDLPISPPVLLPSTPFQTDSPYTWNIERINAPEVWDMGYDGSGVLVGIFDSGVDYTHPDLAEKYRGGDNSWFDPFGEHDQPYDYKGHGTHVTGIILGGNASGKYIGVAPGVKWIAARHTNDAGESANNSDIHKIFQWFMDPDGNPETDDAPDVVNNSWSYNEFYLSTWCYPNFRDDIRAWRMAGIIPVAAAGNSGPLFFTGNTSANYPETISVGFTDVLDVISFFSSRGPSNCDFNIFPDLVAPGLAIPSSFPNRLYAYREGASMAAPHVTGTIALMLNVNPNLNIEEIKSTLKETAKPLGLFHPNNTYGWGRVDALAAVSAVIP